MTSHSFRASELKGCIVSHLKVLIKNKLGFCFTKSVAALLRYVMLGQSYPVCTVIMSGVTFKSHSNMCKNLGARSRSNFPYMDSILAPNLLENARLVWPSASGDPGKLEKKQH